MKKLARKFLIGADGRNSWVARQLGLTRSAAVQGRSVGFQVRLRSTGAIGGQIAVHLFPGGYAGVVGLGDGTITLGMAIDKRRLGRERGAEFLFNNVLSQNPPSQRNSRAQQWRHRASFRVSGLFSATPLRRRRRAAGRRCARRLSATRRRKNTKFNE